MPKKTKAIKKGDLDKPWNRYNAGGRSSRVKDLNKVILIVCEGQSEEYYFKSFPLYGIQTEVVNLEGQSKLKLVKTATTLSREANYDGIWCVFDMDKNVSAKELADFDNAIHQAVSKGFEVAYSNDSFELWLYLHYNDHKVTCRRDYLYQCLGETWQMNYVKVGKKIDFCRGLYQKLEDDPLADRNLAIARAKALHAEKEHLAYHQQNPVTLVYKLVEYLLGNLRARHPKA